MVSGILALVLAGALVSIAPLPASAAAGQTLYVDGKTGLDNNTGRSSSDAFKTIAKAASSLPAGSGAAGWTVSVKGYKDYVYRERPIPSGWNRSGSSVSHLRFEATGYVPGSGRSYVKPIVSGGDLAPAAGHRWAPSGVRGVWVTPWAAAPFGYGQYPGSLRAALFQNTRTWLWEQSSLTALAERAKVGKGGFWYDRTTQKLYVSAVGSPSTGGTDPSRYAVEVVMRNAFLFFGTYGVRHVEVRGFEVRHAANGIAFTKGADYGVVVDNVVTGNLMMGIQTSGGQTASGPDPAVGHIVTRNVGSYNTIQMIKVDEGTVDSSFCDNDSSHNGLQGIKVQGPPGGTSYSGATKGIVVCRNTLHDNTYNPTGSAYNNASGLTIANGAQDVSVEANHIFGNDVGIHVTQESANRLAMNGVRLNRNDVHDNRRFGLNLYDGGQGASRGGGSLRSDHDLYWRNGIGIMAARGTTNKRVDNATVFDNRTDGVRVGESGKEKAALSVTASVITHNDGYGVSVVTGSRAELSYSNLVSNRLGATKGSPTKRSVNAKSPRYVSTAAGSRYFLRIPPSSYQYTAGPAKTPIGAR